MSRRAHLPHSRGDSEMPKAKSEESDSDQDGSTTESSSIALASTGSGMDCPSPRAPSGSKHVSSQMSGSVGENIKTVQ